jgi:hypothetical protein
MIKQRRTFAVIALLITIVALIFVRQMRQHTTDWTIMIYMCGDNEFEQFADNDFKRIASVGSSANVKIVIQFDHAQHDKASPTDPYEPHWSETLRFYVRKAMPALRATAFANLGEQDMSSGKTVAAFVEDAQKRFPANHYALVMWGHGYGFRALKPGFQPLTGTVTNSRSFGQFAGLTKGAFKSGTPDNDPPGKGVLYNSELASSLHSVLKKPLDILFFDECIMGAVETAYAERKVTNIMIASEELVPEDKGVPYPQWLTALKLASWMGPKTLTYIIVKTYQIKYLASVETLAGFDLRRIDSVASAVTDLAQELQRDLVQQIPAILNARKECRPYAGGLCNPPAGDCVFNVDLERFCWKLIVKTSSWRVRWLASRVIARQRVARLANGASPVSWFLNGSHGLSIYFPPDGESYCADIYNNCGYEERNLIYPLAFVEEHQWDNFLHAYFSVVVDVQHPDPLHPQPLPADCRSIHNCSP